MNIHVVPHQCLYVLLWRLSELEPSLNVSCYGVESYVQWMCAVKVKDEELEKQKNIDEAAKKIGRLLKQWPSVCEH